MVDDRTQLEKVFELPSTDGWNCIVLHVQETKSIDRGQYCVGMLSLSGQFWDRALWLRSDSREFELTEEYEVRLPQVVVCLQGLLQLRAILEENRGGQQSASLIGPSEYQELTLSVLPPDSSLAVKDKPVVTCVFRVARLQGEIRFVTDQSCIRIASESLQSWLHGRGH